MYLKVKLNTLPPTLNHAYGHTSRGMKFKRQPLKEFEGDVEKALEGVVWAFSELQPLALNLIVASPKCLVKGTQKRLNKKGGDIDGRIKHAMDAVFKYFKAEDANVVRVTASKIPSTSEWCVIEVIGLDMKTWLEEAEKERAKYEQD